MQLIIERFSKIRLELDSWMRLFEEMRCVEGRNVVYVKQLLRPDPEERLLISSKGVFRTPSINRFGIASQLIPWLSSP